jgi:hypothetical protein
MGAAMQQLMLALARLARLLANSKGPILVHLEQARARGPQPASGASWATITAHDATMLPAVVTIWYLE